MKQKSSARAPRFGSNSEVILPLSPRGLKSQNGLATFPGGPSKGNLGNERCLLTVQLRQRRLVVKGIDMADRARAIDHQHLLGRRVEVTTAWQVGIVGIDVRPDRNFSAELRWIVTGRRIAFTGKQLRQAETTEGTDGVVQKATPIEAAGGHEE